MTTSAPVTITSICTFTLPPERIEQVVRGLMENCPEGIISMRCVRYKYNEWRYSFVDYEDGKRYDLDKEKLLATFPLLYTDKYPKGLIPPPRSNNDNEWEEWTSYADADVLAAFVELACFGEVVFG